MTSIRRIAITTCSVLAIASAVGMGLSTVFSDTLSFVSKAEARMGRPATPVSVAGVGRRTVRRCAAGVYSC